MDNALKETELEIQKSSNCQEYLNSLESEWGEDNGEKYAQSDLKTLVYENLRTYHHHLIDQGRLFSKEVADLFKRLSDEGGQVICTGQLSVSQIENARLQDRIAVDMNGIGYVWFPVTRMEGQED